MPVKVQIPQAMRQHADGQSSVDLSGANVKEVLDALGVKFPNIVGRIFDNGQVRRFVNIYLNDEDIRYLDNLQSPTKDGDVLSIIPAAPAATLWAKASSSSTMFGLLPPSSCVTRFTVAAALRATSTPARVEPVKDTISMPGWLDSATPTPGPSP